MFSKWLHGVSTVRNGAAELPPRTHPRGAFADRGETPFQLDYERNCTCCVPLDMAHRAHLQVHRSVRHHADFKGAYLVYPLFSRKIHQRYLLFLAVLTCSATERLRSPYKVCLEDQVHQVQDAPIRMLLPIGAYPRCTRAGELFTVFLRANPPDWCGSEGVERCTRGCGYERVHGPWSASSTSP